MKILFYSPYFPRHRGGGEKYLLDCASVAARAGHQVYVASGSQPLTEAELLKLQHSLAQFGDFALSQLKFISCPLGSKVSFLKKLLWTGKFDTIYYQTDGSLFFSLARRNILHIQVPLPIKKNSLLERLKLANWRIKNTNSAFTKKYIEQWWRTKINFVQYPYVDQQELANFEHPLKKEKIILHVGRFFPQLHSKKQEVLIDIFQQLRQTAPKALSGWQLVLVGELEDPAYGQLVKERAKDLPVVIHHHLSRQELVKFYKQASIYWHATGFAVDEVEHPEKMEHFGISVVEAMAAGAVPVVINKGGLPEILGKDLTDLLWQSPDECLSKTLALVKDKEQRQELALQVNYRSRYFSKSRFSQTLLKMLS